MGTIEELRSNLEPGDVLLFRSDHCVSELIRASEPGCMVNHAAIVTRAGGTAASKCPGIVMANWDFKPATLSGGAITTFDLDDVHQEKVRAVYVMRPEAGGTEPYAERALEMLRHTSRYQFDAGGMLTICAGLERGHPGGYWRLAWAARHCLARFAPPSGTSSLDGAQRSLVTCAAFVYLCFTGSTGNALGPVVAERPSLVGGRGSPGRLPLAFRILVHELAATRAVLVDPEDPLWVTPNWLFHCQRLNQVARWEPDIPKDG